MLEHIDAHLEESLDVERLSVIAGFSKYHFHRQFVALFDIGIFSYVQLTRLRDAPSMSSIILAALPGFLPGTRDLGL